MTAPARGLPAEIVVATGNPHKIEEIRAILGPAGVRVVGLDELTCSFEEPVEDAPTFAGNAEIKAKSYARQTGRVCLADDSGLVVDALDGAPGVLSARYAGVDGDRAARDAANNAKLLAALEGVPTEHRTARFVCAMCLAEPDGTGDVRIVATSEGTFAGHIGTEARGANGFGYDPLLVLADGRTSAELDPAEKNARSHRGAAARALVRAMGLATS